MSFVRRITSRLSSKVRSLRFAPRVAGAGRAGMWTSSTTQLRASTAIAMAAGLYAASQWKSSSNSQCLSWGTSEEKSKVPAGGIPGTDQERTFIAIKPDGVQRGLVGRIIQRFEDKGYKLVALRMIYPTKAKAESHYADLSKKPFFPRLVEFFSSGPVVAMVWEGNNVILTGRKMLGTTNPRDSTPGSIRGDFSVQVGKNIIHGSDGPESAQDEIKNWFGDDVIDYTLDSDKWVYN